MRAVVAVALIYSSIATPILVAMGRLPEASVHMLAIGLAYIYWTKDES
jgi:hypothetical protein